MNRDNIINEINSIKNNCILIEHPTGYGKTRTAIERMKHVLDESIKSDVLIVINRNVHKGIWMNELDKWWKNRNINVDFITYMALSLMNGDIKSKKYNFIICDECHHFSDNSFSSFLDYYEYENLVLLSATVKFELKKLFKDSFHEFTYHKITLRQAIENKVLPDPEIYLYPLELDNTNKCCSYKIKKNGKYETVYCTQKGMIANINGKIEYYKNRFWGTRSENDKRKWLYLCKERLNKLSEYKEWFIIELLKEYNNERTVTFCCDINQTERLGEYCINSKNKESYKNLEMFNNGEINHITTCDMLNEGVNLYDCKVGIFAKLSGSEIIIKQRNGRLLRHKEPVFIIPYFIGTREEELVGKMILDYNKERIKIKNNIWVQYK